MEKDVDDLKAAVAALTAKVEELSKRPVVNTENGALEERTAVLERKIFGKAFTPVGSVADETSKQ